MDILLVAIIFAIGYIRVLHGDVTEPSVNIAVNEFTGEVCEIHNDIPIGNNLMLNKEMGAFMQIVKELKLV